MRLERVVVALWICAWTTSALAEPAPEPPTPAATRAEAPYEHLPLSLSEAINLGIENNTDVQLVRFEPPIAQLEHTAAWGLHDPTLFGDYRYISQKLPVASAFFPSQFVERDSVGHAGVAGLVPRIGWTYALTYAGSDVQTNSIIQSFGTTYTSSLTLSLVAPLLRGAWWGAAWTQVELTGIGSELALQEFRKRLTDIVARVELSYWGLVARKQELEVANKSLETRRALLAQVKARYEVGVVSRVDVTEGEAGVAERESNQIRVENRYRNAQDELIDSVYGPRLTPTSRLEVEPTDKPEDYVTFLLDPEGSMQRALQRRPEQVIARQRVEQSEIFLKYAKNERLPQLDAVGNYGTHGLSGNNPNCPFTSILPGGGCAITPTQPSGIGTEYSDNTDFWFDGNKNRVWSAGALLSIPIPNTTARANVSKGELELRRANTNVRRVEQDIVKEVRDSVRNLTSALEDIEAAERFVAAAREQLRAERIRLEHGEATPFDVNQREDALVEAESRRIGALFVYHGSVTTLDRAQGTLLEDRSIVLDRALPLR